MRRYIALIAVAVAACGSGANSNISKSQRIVQEREIYAAAVDPALPDATIAAAAKSLCAVGTDMCTVVLVPTDAALPTGFPVSDAEAPSVIGFYNLNRNTGMDEFRRGKVE